MIVWEVSSMKRKLSRYIRNRRLMAGLAATLFALDLVITMIASTDGWIQADAAQSMSLSSMRARAEAIVNYEWVPSRDITVWNKAYYEGSNVFKAGKKVKGVPFTLFTSEVVKRSLVTLSEYKNLASSNYSTTAICKSRRAERTGPVYGSCCASFVSEVMGGSYMGNNVSSIQNSKYANHKTKARARDIKPGDALNKSTHAIWIGDVTDKYYVIYEQTPPVARKVVIKKSSVIDSSGRFYYRGSIYESLTRYNVTDTAPIRSAPNASTAYRYYAENASVPVQWNAVSNASYYLVDVIKDGETVVSEEVVTSNYYSVDKGNGNYKVYVTAVSGNTKKKSSCVEFSIGYLDTPVLENTDEVYPHGATIDFTWNNCVGATEYHFTMQNDDSISCCETDLTDTTYSVSPEDGYYEVTVEAKNTNGGLQTASSQKYAFFVGNKRRILIDSSDSYYAHGGQVNVKWNDCEGVSDYTLLITSDGTECFRKTVSGKSSYAVKDLPDGYYKAVVSAVESNGEYDWMPSREYAFYVGKLDQPVVVPESKYVPCNSRAGVSWKACTGAVGYHVVIRSGDAVVYEDNLSGTSCNFDVQEGKYGVTVSAVNTNGGYQECASDVAEVWGVSVSISQSVDTMHPGETAVFSADISEHDPADVIEWTTGDQRILTVTSDGEVTAKGAGSTIVKASLGSCSVYASVNVVPSLSFDTLGASIRLSEPYGIRFGTRVDKNEDFNSVKITEYGTLIISAGSLGNEELTLNTPNVLKIKAKKFLEETSGHLIYTGVLINIPKSFFDTEVVGRGYLKYQGIDGKEYVLYSAKVEKTFNGVVTAAYDNYSRLENPTRAQQEILKKLKLLYDEANPAPDEDTSSTESTEQTTAVTSADDKSGAVTSATEPTEAVTSATEPTEAVTSADGESEPVASDGEPSPSSTVAEATQEPETASDEQLP